MGRISVVDLKNKQTSCFAYSDKGCRATTKKDCKGCLFYKTKEQVRNEQIKTEKRIGEKYGMPYKAFIEMKGLC